MAFPASLSTRSAIRVITFLAAVSLSAASLPAQAVAFSITDANRIIGSGYGSDGNESKGTKLVVKFTDSFSIQHFSLDMIGQEYSFDIGKVQLFEPPSHGGINGYGTDRKFNRLCEPKAASGREASEGQRAGQGSTECSAGISEVSERASAGFGRRLQAQRAGVRSGAAAPSVAEDGGYQETR
jgi:hypothetical protein